MPFTDAQLAAAMRAELVNSGVMTNIQQGQLLDDSREDNVRNTLTNVQLGNFAVYWAALGAWVNLNGGNIVNTTGANVPGRNGGNPVNIGTKALYNDVFHDVNQYINGPAFLPVKAVSNHLRFVSVLG